MKIIKVKSPLAILALSVFCFFFLDNIIFRSGFYTKHLTNRYDNAAFRLYHAQQRTAATDKPKILMIGNSAIHAAFNLIEFQKDNPKAPFEVIPLLNHGVGLTVQYHLLKEVDPQRNQYKAIIIPLESYKMLSDFDHTNNDEDLDSHKIGSFIRTKEWPNFLKEYKNKELQHELLLSYLFFNRLFSDDLRRFVPTKRIMQNFDSSAKIEQELNGGSKRKDSLEGLKLNANNEIMTCPFTADRCAGLNYGPHPVSKEQKEINAKNLLAFEKNYLTKIVRLYKDSPTEIWFIKIPHTAFTNDRSPLPNAPEVADILPKQKNIHFLNQNYFEDLSQFKYMSDSMHLTTTGCNLFTKRITPVLYELAQDKKN